MGNLKEPVWVIVALCAWLVVGLYFIVSAFRTRRIQQRESKQARTQDSFLLWGGYFFLFVELQTAWWQRAFLPPTWRQPVGVAGAAIAIAGLAFTLWARVALGQYWSRIVAVKEDHRLVTTGPYRRVRHPLYSGLLLATLGTALAYGRWHALVGVALLWAGFLSRAHREDALMAGQFGAEFAAYRTRTGRLLPRTAR